MDAPLLSFHCVHCGESGVVWKDGETYVPDDRMLERMRRERERHRKEEEKRR